MKNHFKHSIPVFIIIILVSVVTCPVLAQKAKHKSHKSGKEIPADTIITNVGGSGETLELYFHKGPGHNHPLMAIWMEDTDGNYIQTLYVAKSIASGIFMHGDKTTGHWQPGEVLRPASLPYWAHKRDVLNDKGNYMPTPANPVADAYSGATPPADFVLKTRADVPSEQKYMLLLEINQSWDWNEFWTNNKFPDKPEYKTSSQPAVVYAVEIDPAQKGKMYELKPIGRSHYSGEDGMLYHDLETLTSALEITSGISVVVR